MNDSELLQVLHRGVRGQEEGRHSLSVESYSTAREEQHVNCGTRVAHVEHIHHHGHGLGHHQKGQPHAERVLAHNNEVLGHMAPPSTLFSYDGIESVCIDTKSVKLEVHLLQSLLLEVVVESLVSIPDMVIHNVAGYFTLFIITFYPRY